MKIEQAFSIIRTPTKEISHKKLMSWQQINYKMQYDVII